MKSLRVVLGALVAAAFALLPAALPSAAAAQTAPSASIMLLHGIPGATVDVVVDGQVVIPGFRPGDMQDLSAFAGQTLRNVEVRAAGTSTVVIGPIASLAVPASGNVTVVAHLSADGTPTLTPFANDTSATPAGQGRLIVRHVAAAPAVDIVVGDARPVTNLSNPNQAALLLPAGTISGAQVAPSGGDPIATAPDLDLRAGTDLIVYAVGSLADGSFTFYTQTISGLGGSPSSVEAGNSPVSSGRGTTTALLAGAVALLVVGSGALAVRRRAITTR